MLGIIDLDRRAVAHSVDIVARITVDDLDRPTPCTAWKLWDLLAHMTVQHRGFAASARGGGADPAVWIPRTVSDDPVADYREAAADVTVAFSEPDVLERIFELPEFDPGFTAPGRLAVGFHFIDYVVHGWDVARTLGVPFELEPTLAEPALKIALEVPTGERRLRPNAAFAPVLAEAAGSAMDRILTTLGRSPNWPS
jgi:uncharacterized protein (TIGR03086 family)